MRFTFSPRCRGIAGAARWHATRVSRLRRSRRPRHRGRAPQATPVQATTPLPVVLPPVPQVAPGYAAPPNAPLPNGDLVGVTQQPFVGIKLEDALAMALQRNTDLAVAESNTRIANFQVVAAQGAYDVQFQLVPQYSRSTTPALSPFQGGPERRVPSRRSRKAQPPAFTGQTATGGRATASASPGRRSTTTRP